MIQDLILIVIVYVMVIKVTKVYEITKAIWEIIDVSKIEDKPLTIILKSKAKVDLTLPR